MGGVGGGGERGLLCGGDVELEGVLERLQAQTDLTEHPVEAMGEQSIGNSRDRSFN